MPESVDSFKKRVVTSMKGHKRCHMDKATEGNVGLVSSVSFPILTPKHCGVCSGAGYLNELSLLVCKNGVMWL